MKEVTKPVILLVALLVLLGFANAHAASASLPERPQCGNAISYEAIGACSAKHSAVAADQLNILTERSIWISTASTIALILTLLVTTWATRAATIAAKASLAGVEHSRYSSARELRPYILQNLVSTTPILSEEDRTTIVGYEFKVQWQNCGRTPAKNVMSYGNCNWQPEGPPANFDFPDHVAAKKLGALGPGHTAYDKWYIAIDVLKKVYEKETVLSIYGWIEYEGFELNSKYRTEFYLRLDPRANPAVAPSEFVPTIMDVHNGIDDTCLRAPGQSVKEYSSASAADHTIH